MVSSMCGDALVRSTKKIVPCLQSSKVVVASWSWAAWLLLVLGAAVYWGKHGSQHVLWHSEAEDDVLLSETTRWQLPCCWRWRWWSGQVYLHTWTLLSTCGASSSRRRRSTMCLTTSSSVMSFWRSGRGCQQQPVQLWWIPCLEGLRQC